MRNGDKSPIIRLASPLRRLPGLEGTVIATRRRTNRARFFALAAARFDMLLLALFFALGTAAGFALSCRCRVRLAPQLHDYAAAYLALLPRRTLSGEAVLRTLWAYLRAPAAAFFLGFCSLGAAALPLLCLAEGFLLSFSLFSFSLALGRAGYALVAAIFALRLFAVPPCLMLCAAGAMASSRALAAFSLGAPRRAARPAADGGRMERFLVCCVCLLCACALELWLLPQLAAWLAQFATL